MPTEDFRVTRRISPATFMLRKVNVHTYGPSELLHAPTTYGEMPAEEPKFSKKYAVFKLLKK